MRRAETDTLVLQVSLTKMAGRDSNMQATVDVDGACPLCTAETGHHQSQNGEDRFYCVDVSKADAALCRDPEGDLAKRRFHTRPFDGTRASGARAISVIWQKLTGGRWVARLARLPGVTAFLEVGYRLLPPIRSVVSKPAARCGPNPALQSRSAR